MSKIKTLATFIAATIKGRNYIYISEILDFVGMHNLTVEEFNELLLLIQNKHFLNIRIYNKEKQND